MKYALRDSGEEARLRWEVAEEEADPSTELARKGSR
jgi:hypothetical protein